MTRYLVDALDLGHNPKGISRVLSSLVPRLVTQSADEVLVACTPEGAARLTGIPGDCIVDVRRHLQSRWEQVDLPLLARRLRAQAVYSHRESGALWGAPLLLHVPEDPYVRWLRDPPQSARAHARRAYSRLTMRAALKRCAVVGASTPTVARQLASRYSLSTVSVIPLGVDLDLFRPSHTPTGGSIFHLGSSDPRDRTVLVVEAWALARQRRDDLPRLVVGGGLASVKDLVERRATELGVPVELTGRLSDEALAEQLRNAAAVVQPSSDEGFGLQPLEAMASGAPVVVTEAGAVLDVVGDAAVVRSATAAALADGIACALAEAGALRGAARRRAETYSWDSSASAALAGLAVAAESNS